MLLWKVYSLKKFDFYQLMATKNQIYISGRFTFEPFLRF